MRAPLSALSPSTHIQQQESDNTNACEYWRAGGASAVCIVVALVHSLMAPPCLLQLQYSSEVNCLRVFAYLEVWGRPLPLQAKAMSPPTIRACWKCAEV